MHEAICDTSPIQYLHQTGYLHLLAEFYTRIIIPPAVVDELERGRSIGVDLPDVRPLPWLTIQAPEGLDKVLAAADLGAGEKEVLALGTEVPGAVLILDERLGRLHAEALKLTFTGTLGILLRAKVEDRILRIEPLLEHLDRLGFRLSARTRAAAPVRAPPWSSIRQGNRVRHLGRGDVEAEPTKVQHSVFRNEPPPEKCYTCRGGSVRDGNSAKVPASTDKSIPQECSDVTPPAESPKGTPGGRTFTL